MTLDEAYVKAGFEKNRGNAARLNADESIARRVTELQAIAARRASVSTEWVLTKLKQLAIKAPEPKVRVQALGLIAKHLGMFEHTRRIEHSGRVQTDSVDLRGLAPEKFEQLRALVQEAQTTKRAD